MNDKNDGGGAACAVKVCIALALVALFPCPLHAQHGRAGSRADALSELRAGFAQPPAAARLRCYWWWLNGHTDKPTIANDLREMKAKGFGGALLVDANGADQGGNLPVPAGPTFGSPAWVELYRYALSEADRLGLEITLNINSGWNLGGPVVAPAEASKVLTWSRVDVKGGESGVVKVPAPASKNGFYRDIVVLAYPLKGAGRLRPGAESRRLAEKTAAVETGFSMPDSDWMLSKAAAGDRDESGIEHASIVDISSRMRSDGVVDWKAPEGEWEIVRVGYTDSDARVSTASGAWQGLALDHMSRSAFDSYWDRVVEPLLAVAAPFHSLRYLTTDSWELGGTNWTDDFAAEFKRRRGYDPLPWLPVVTGRVIDSPEASDRFLADLRRTVADLIAENHYARFAERAAAHHLGVEAESGGPHGAPIDALETFQRSAVPQTEFWSVNAHRSRDESRFFAKEAASAANIYGRKLVAEEGETSVGPQWSESLASDLKPSFDMAVTEGMNRLVWHEFTSSPASTGLPGQEYFAGTHLNPKVTWWAVGDAFFTYLNRVQFMMQQGTPVDDVLYFYGDNIPAFVRLKADDPARVLPGYDYDVTDEDALLHTIRMDGSALIGPSGVRWRALALPKSGRVSLTVLRLARRYVRGGGLLIGEAPSSPIGRVTPAVQAEFDGIVQDIWGKDGCAEGSRRSVGKGTVFCGRDGRKALEGAGLLPDAEVAQQAAGSRTSAQASFGSSFDYAHRRDGDTEIYFVRNGSDHAVEEQVDFRVSVKIARDVEVWDPVSGEAWRPSRVQPTADGRTQVSLELPAFGSCFVVFSPGAGMHVQAAKVVDRIVPANPSDGWTLTFQAGRGAPDQPAHLSKLSSWTELPGQTKHFAGTATYKAMLAAPEFKAGEQVWLTFTDVREVARVRINGHPAGTVWTKPLSVRVDPWLKKGNTLVQIEVTNLWPNRIIGDLQPTTTHRITHTNIRAYHADSPLLPSGLIGPIQWEVRR